MEYRRCQDWRFECPGQHSDYRGRSPFDAHVPGEPDLRGYALLDGDLPGNVAVDNDLRISVRKGGIAGVTILYRFAAGNS